MYHSKYFSFRRQIHLTDAQISDKLQQLFLDREQMQAEFNDLVKSITATLLDAWKAEGGCQVCWGSNLVVTWSTLDGPGWTERGECTACTSETSTVLDLIGAAPKAVGKAPGCRYVGGYGAYNVGPLSIDEIGELAEYKKEFALLSTYEIHLSAFDRDIEDEQVHCEVDKGKTVVVIKGRKVPKGTTGECFWVGDDNYSGGKRIGMKDAAGQTHWTAMDNVKVAAWNFFN